MRRWRDASAVIVAARSNFPNHQKSLQSSVDYVVLTAQRSSKSSFLPEGYVFPGGVIEPQNDSSEQWNKLHKRLKFQRLNFEISDKPSDALNVFKTPNEEQLPRSISLRIAAIRETFEECGILLCRFPSQDQNSQFGHNLIISEAEVNDFNENKSPNKFFDLCDKLECFPDIWSLSEARNWLTPAFFNKRFDTAFFICCLDQTPPVQIDQSEISDFKWKSPLEYITLHKTGKLNLPPPQLYEFHDIAQFETLHSVSEAARNRHFCSERCYLPVRFLLKDGAVILLPGDSNYLLEVNEKDVEYKNLNIQDFRAQAAKLHRFEIYDKQKPIFMKKL